MGLRFQWREATVIAALDGATAMQAFWKEEPDLVILEAGLPDMSGYRLVEEIRQRSNVPVVMISSECRAAEEVRGLEAGADVCMCKPLSHLAFLARIKAVLRRAQMASMGVERGWMRGELSIDFQSRRVSLRGETVKLTPMEFNLLCYLVRYEGRVVMLRSLGDYLMGPEHPANAAHLKVFVSRIRAKIERPHSRRYIETVRGFGYRFVAREEPDWAPRLSPTPHRLHGPE